MILSVSRRTDIPAFYSEWLMNRFADGYVMVRNPMNYYQVSKIAIDPSVVDCIVFWTKNPKPLLKHIDFLENKYKFYFQYTLNPYEKDVEKNLPPFEERLDCFTELGKRLGSKRVIWRYDPILLNEKYTSDWHIEKFQNVAERLKGITETCIFSFMDFYPKVNRNLKGLNIRDAEPEEINKIAEAFSAIAKVNNISLRTCAEKIDLAKFGIQHNSCIDGKLISEIIGYDIEAKKDKNQREECGCIESIDIGQYNTCRHGCCYCYANFNPASVSTFSKQHDQLSPFLIGHSEPADKVTERKLKKVVKQKAFSEQLSLF